jgi:excisionase family DNA binding protein
MRFYKVKEAAKAYGIGKNRLYDAVKSKELRAYKPNCKTLLLKESELEEWVEKYPA